MQQPLGRFEVLRVDVVEMLLLLPELLTVTVQHTHEPHQLLPAAVFNYIVAEVFAAYIVAYPRKGIARSVEDELLRLLAAEHRAHFSEQLLVRGRDIDNAARIGHGREYIILTSGLAEPEHGDILYGAYPLGTVNNSIAYRKHSETSKKICAVPTGLTFAEQHTEQHIVY